MNTYSRTALQFELHAHKTGTTLSLLVKAITRVSPINYNAVLPKLLGHRAAGWDGEGGAGAAAVFAQDFEVQSVLWLWCIQYCSHV